MGLFDYIKCELPLPSGQHDLYQSKDTPEQYMAHYLITSEGALVRHTWDTEETGEEWVGPFGVMKQRRGVPGSDRFEPVLFDGDVTFYETETYMATFRKGQLSELHHLVSEEWVEVFDAKSARIAALEAELAEARKDGARLDWVEKDCTFIEIQGDEERYWLTGRRGHGPDFEGETFRAAIDAAMAKGGAE